MSLRRNSLKRFRPVLETLEDRLVLDDTSAGLNGILARGLTTYGGFPLTGVAIGIGQVEPGRPGKPNAPINDSVPNFAHNDVVPAAVFRQAQNPTQNSPAEIDGHAERVAGVMIANNATNTHEGVAPSAELFAATFTPVNVFAPEQSPALALNHIATRNNGDIRAINFSAGFATTAPLDGSSFLTRFVDWSAREHDTLYVIGGNELPGGIPLPSDEYNGMTVAFSEKDANGVFRIIATENVFTEDAAGLRRSTDIVAPGLDILFPTLGQAAYILGTRANGMLGTSYAAPHVTGAVALLQEYADDRIFNGAPGWDPVNARRHQVLKAVLMNSADKIQGLLGMSRTVLKKDGTNWNDSDAKDAIGNEAGRFIPLDSEMGTGHLNVSRALEQFSPGQYPAPGAAGGVPAIGWDYNSVDGSQIRKYPFEKTLLGAGHVSITVAWDSIVNLVEFPGGIAGRFDATDSFQRLPLSQVRLYLVQKGATSTENSVWSSESWSDNVQHIFFQLPPGNADYEFWIQTPGPNIARYGVAWWAEEAPPPPPPPPAPPAETPTLSISDVSLTEGNSGTKEFVFTVTLSTPATQTVTVDYTTGGSDASSENDYVAQSGTLTFAQGQSSKTIVILVNSDTYQEMDEKFYVHLDNAVNATIDDGEGEGLILNDDSIPAPGLDAINDNATCEGDYFVDIAVM
ncbi:MAG: S8 family serine peptidase [Gemmataceae bacterium]|nr:S8 family serine peptidase [Gemmataceae bacterium]MCI0739507.1 S8 family serine peptidase [Gemmataceae bacterium]